MSAIAAAAGRLMSQQQSASVVAGTRSLHAHRGLATSLQNAIQSVSEAVVLQARQHPMQSVCLLLHPELFAPFILFYSNKSFMHFNSFDSLSWPCTAKYMRLYC
jgi:hypothetical protein